MTHGYGNLTMKRGTVGGIVLKRGYVATEDYFGGVTSTVLEKRLGYRAGRLSDGWYVLFLVSKLRPDEFEVCGYNQMSGGISVGRVANPPDLRNSKKKLTSDGYDMNKIKTELVNNTFRIIGHKRLTQIIPVRREFGGNDDPRGALIPQWKITAPKPFRVAKLIQPGEMYRGNYA